MNKGTRRVGKFVCIDFLPSETLQFGMTASRRYGTAPERNRFKRIVREAFRKIDPSLFAFKLNVVPRSLAKKAKTSDIINELTHLLS